MKHAFIITVHKQPELVERLVRSLQHEDLYCFIHVDKKSDIREFTYLESLNNAILIKNRVDVMWATFKYVDAIIASLEEALAFGRGIRSFTLLSGQDYPIKSAGKIADFLNIGGGRDICPIADKSSAWYLESMGRYEKYHMNAFRFKGKYVLQSVLNTLLPKRTVPGYSEIFAGRNSQWWTFTREVIEHIVSAQKRDKKLRRFLKFTWGTDEFFFATVVYNSEFRKRIENSLYRFTSWDEGKWNPNILTIDHLRELEDSDCIFARKFDLDVDREVLDRLQEKINEQPS
ncbi:MAG: Uncharacterised protein [Flavobacteriia bacterium]|nr:MAG: Uncharacterised protein [Flavobacteriia bacterium]